MERVCVVAWPLWALGCASAPPPPPESAPKPAEQAGLVSITGFIPITTQSSTAAYSAVAARAGAFPRDVVTKRVITELGARTGTWGRRVPSNLMEGLTPTAPPVDADPDGMADDWERAHGLNPADGTDHVKVMASGYTAIEDYINERAAALVN